MSYSFDSDPGTYSYMQRALWKQTTCDQEALRCELKWAAHLFLINPRNPNFDVLTGAAGLHFIIVSPEPSHLTSRAVRHHYKPVTYLNSNVRIVGANFREYRSQLQQAIL